MKISYRWLQQYVDCQISAHELAGRLTMAGLEVEGLEELSYTIPDRVVVGEILDVQRHENASKLYVCQVDVGEEAPRTIVCGAPNTISHAKVVVALPGANLPNGMSVRDAEIRGVASSGMICAEDELGISDDHSGILILPDEMAAGTALSAELLGLEPDDTILEIGLTPNRGDCLSHFGVAREVATLLHLPYHLPSVEYVEDERSISDIAAVSIENPELCQRYTGSVISDVTIGPSPLWLKRRLESVGVRSINNVVDVTNFVMLELGQPLHAFDLDQVAERQIIVRTAREGQTFITLDDVERELDETVLMIADASRDVAIGGVMGGQNSEVSDSTTNVLLESARFDPSSIRKTAKKLGLNTEASHRFERSVDMFGSEIALRRATKLIAELSGGRVAKGIIDEFPSPVSLLQVSLRWARIEKILGIAIDTETVKNILSTLGFRLLEETPETLFVEVPSFRPDVEREIDLIEEIGRIYGFDNIPTTLPSGHIPPKVETSTRRVEHILRNVLVSQGLDEVIHYSFFDQQYLTQLGIDKKSPYNKVVALKNPLTVEHGVLRTTTIPGLLEICKLNRSNRQEDLRFFEIGKVFYADPSQSLPQEKRVVSGLLTGHKTDLSWAQQQQFVDFYDVKGLLENVLRQLIVLYEFRRPDDCLFLHPGESAQIVCGDAPIGFVGKLHPDVCETFDLGEERIYVFELSIELLAARASLQKTFKPLPKFPAVHRDLALIAPASLVQASDIERMILEAGKPLLEHLILFDRYVGPQIAKDHVGLTYSLRYRSPEKTLTDNEVSEVHEHILEQLRTHLGIRLR
ncbi:phenylalanine--tRNA ligase subunit beta [candidate division KSB3 bacterium]|uniref:Phenylalanine--tRNA ligase beta subunit n=1 Tax=candidate division KSB3 bacterium TaxID=2044937 RepID=A0A2G6KK70_9BACT|nr:MAG: phenylalanine--tRNA ligase subunit beta [candidate division KSB3 bacterium]